MIVACQQSTNLGERVDQELEVHSSTSKIYTLELKAAL